MNKSIKSYIPQTDPKASYLSIKDKIESAIHSVLESGWYVLGQEVEKFEKNFASYLGVEFAVGVNSGTDALELALRSLGVGSKDLVFTVSHTAVATASAILRCGAAPVFVDIDHKTFTMDPNHLEDTIKAISNGHLPLDGIPKAIIPVHLYGRPADMSAILEIASKHDLYVIEDCAQAHGAEYNSAKTGTFGHMAAFSFYPTKNLGAFGDGGMVVTNDEDLDLRCLALRQYGWEQRFISSMIGINSRLDELQAAVLNEKLNFLDKNNQRRIEIAGMYHHALENNVYKLPEVTDYKIKHVHHQYVIRARQRDKVKVFLEKNGVGSAIHYPVPIHKQPAFQKWIISGPGGLSHTEKVCEDILSLPMFPELQNEQVDLVCNLMRSWANDIKRG